MRTFPVNVPRAIAVPAQKPETVARISALLEPREKHMPAAASMTGQGLSMGRAFAFRVIHREEAGITLAAALAQRAVSGDRFPAQFVAVVFADAAVVRAILEAVSLLPVKMLSFFCRGFVSPFLPSHKEIIL